MFTNEHSSNQDETGPHVETYSADRENGPIRRNSCSTQEPSKCVQNLDPPLALKLPRTRRGKKQAIASGSPLKRPKSPLVNWESILEGIIGGNTAVEYSTKRKIFWQGQPADSLFYIRHGKVKLAVTSKQGKEAIVAVLGAGEFRCASPRRSRCQTAP